MQRFWSHFIEPLLRALKPQHIVEIGSQGGGNTAHILHFCKEHDSRATIIDPLPIGNMEEIAELLAAYSTHKQGLSLDILPKLPVADAYLIDGDHNWYTVYHEIDTVITKAKTENQPLPLLLFHDVGWPYGRRDLYYDPATVPAEGVLPYVKGGLVPGVTAPVEGEGFNAHLCNALEEGTPENGVCTAVEDATAKYRSDYRLYTIPGWHGLALMAPHNAPEAVETIIRERFILPETAQAYIEQLEHSRCELLVTQHNTRHELLQTRKEARLLRQELEEAHKQVEREQKNLARLYRETQNLCESTEKMLLSPRWRIGNAIITCLSVLLRRPKGTPPLASLYDLKTRLDNEPFIQRMQQKRQAQEPKAAS